MRGSPLFRALLTLGVLLLMAWPVWQITHSRATPITAGAPAPAPAPTLRPAGAAKAQLTLEFLPAAPLEFEVKYLGKSIWHGGGAVTAVSPPLEIAIPAEGVDLQITARWPAEGQHGAVRARLSLPDGAALERLAWTRDGAALDEVLTFVNR